MRSFPLVGWGGFFLSFAVSAAIGASEAHPTRKDRWIERRGDFAVEYSAGDEAYLECAFAEMTRWRTEQPRQIEALRKARAELLALSPEEMRAHRDEILQQVAAGIGLAAPTALQGRTYDAMLGNYRMIGLARNVMADALVKFSDVRTITLWRKSELAARLKAGEAIPLFRYDEPKDEVSFDFDFGYQGSADAAARQEMEAQRLDHSFNYQARPDGVVDFSASFTIRHGARIGEPLQPPAPNPNLERGQANLRAAVGNMTLPEFPLVIAPKDAALPPAEFCAREMERARAMLKFSEHVAAFRDLPLAHVVLHEATEVGLVENYIGSPDRRWLCDGTANYVGWKVIRDRSDVAAADQAYPLAGQLAAAARFQREISLRTWAAVENIAEGDRNSELNRAHYPFATRALFDLARQSGEAAVPKLFQELARTPRPKVTMKTVEKAYAKVTGKKLADLLTQAEKAPIPVPASQTGNVTGGTADRR